MGYMVIQHKGTSLQDYKAKVYELKKLAMEICEDTESMAEEFGERSSYHGGYAERSGYGQRGYDPYEMQERYRRY